MIGLLPHIHHLAEPARALEDFVKRSEVRSAFPRLIRAIGLCQAGSLAEFLEQGRASTDAARRGETGLALARLHGAEARKEVEKGLSSTGSPLETALFAAAVLIAGGRPDLAVVRKALSAGLFESEWPDHVVEDVLGALRQGPDEFQALAAAWQAVVDNEPTNQSELYSLPDPDED
jgi:hypothetical protein